MCRCAIVHSWHRRLVIALTLAFLPIFAPPIRPEPAVQRSGDAVDPALASLGARLFSDPRLSKDATMSCASCHDPKRAFTNPTPPVRDSAVADERLRRDVPSLLNVGAAMPLHRDGREPTLEVQILAPLFNPAEMANTTFADLEARLDQIPEYHEAFLRQFASTPSIDALGRALAAYERTLIGGPAPFDLWQSFAIANAVPGEAKAGFAIFSGKGGCASCHPPGTFTANAFINTGIGFESEARRAADRPGAPSDRGREEVTHKSEDRYRFRTPTLRNVELTAPYMHDGSLKTLEEVVAYYNAGGSPDPEKDARIKPLGLTALEQRQLVAFLKCLTSKDLPGIVPGKPQLK